MHSSLHGQEDSTAILTPELVDKSNIAPRDIRLKKTQAYTATRSTEDIATLPFTTYVVSDEDILRNNFLTLGDLLSTLPGITVSKSGNALEGETFMVLGAPGNSSVKILINNMPVKPAMAKGMPIGAQLPLRQAERVEIVYGASPVLYGSEACAAVVNIILKETERPVFALADLGFGTYGFNNLDISFGGKLGKDKNIFRFSMYGSSTVQQTKDIFWDKENTYNTKLYYTYGQTAVPTDNGRSNFLLEPGQDSIPLLGLAPHESRLFGLNFIWRGIRFSYHRMARQDLSAIGKNPFAVSYANSGSVISERLETYSASFNRRRRKRQSSLLLSVVNYKLEQNSSSQHVFDGLGSALFELQSTSDSMTNAVIKRDIIRQLFSNQRVAALGSFDFRSDFQLNFKTKSPKLTWGLSWLNWVGVGYAYNGYLESPYTGTTLLAEPTGATRPYNPQLDPIGETNLGVHANWKTKKLNVHLSGGGMLAPGYRMIYPRVGIYYQLKDFIGIKANYAQGYQRIAPHTRANTFWLLYPNNSASDIVPASFLFLEEGLLTADNFEQYQSAELGLRAHAKYVQLEGSFFTHQRSGFATNGHFYPWQGQDEEFYVYGYALHPGTETRVNGIKGTANLDSLHLHLNFGKQRRFWWSNRTHLQLSRHSSVLPYSGNVYTLGLQTLASDDIANYPKFIFQWQSTLSADNFDMTVRFFRQSITSTNGTFYRTLFRQNTNSLANTGYSTWDITSRIFLNKNLFAYFNCSNIFNRKYFGIDATGGPDDLQGNPQPGRMVRFGINYNLN